MNRLFQANDHALKGLQQLSMLARSLADGLATVAESPARSPESNLAPSVRAYLRARRRRDGMFGSDMFADPVWDVLLDLFASTLEGRAVCISDACIAASVPPTTALRWLVKMEECKLIVRHQDSTDGRRAYVALSAPALAAMAQWMTAFFGDLHGGDIVEAGSERAANCPRHSGAIDRTSM